MAPHKETPTKSLGAQKLLSLFDEPEDLKAEAPEPIPLEFQGEDLKAEQPAPRAASAYRPALALWALAGFTALTSAAAFMCGRRGGAKAVCGQRMVTVPRGRARRRVLLGDDDTPTAALLEAPSSELVTTEVPSDAAVASDAAVGVSSSPRAQSSRMRSMGMQQGSSMATPTTSTLRSVVGDQWSPWSRKSTMATVGPTADAINDAWTRRVK